MHISDFSDAFFFSQAFRFVPISIFLLTAIICFQFGAIRRTKAAVNCILCVFDSQMREFLFGHTDRSEIPVHGIEKCLVLISII